MKKSSFEKESHITTVLRLVYKLSLLFEEKVSVSPSQKNNPVKHSNSHLVTTLRLLYKLSALLEEKQRRGGVITLRLLNRWLSCLKS